MKGIVFNVVQEVVESRFGPERWDEVVERAGVDGAYTSLGSYPDAELHAIVAAIADLARVSRDDVLVLAGREGFAQLAGRHTELLDGMHDWRTVIEQLDGIIHPEVKKMYPDADVPSFVGRPARPDAVVVEYRSWRQLCRLAEGLALGLGDWFGTELRVTHLGCIHRGDDACLLEIAAA